MLGRLQALLGSLDSTIPGLIVPHGAPWPISFFLFQLGFPSIQRLVQSLEFCRCAVCCGTRGAGVNWNPGRGMDAVREQFVNRWLKPLPPLVPAVSAPGSGACLGAPVLRQGAMFSNSRFHESKNSQILARCNIVWDTLLLGTSERAACRSGTRVQGCSAGGRVSSYRAW